MMTVIAAAALAAQPAPAPANPPSQHEPMMQMGQMQGQHGQMADMKDCCCKDMAKHEGHAEHDRHTGE